MKVRVTYDIPFESLKRLYDYCVNNNVKGVNVTSVFRNVSITSDGDELIIKEIK